MTKTEQEYFQICAWRYLHPLPKGEYGERHHILPKSCGGFDLQINIVKLTPEEHYRCHCLLPKIFDEKRMLKEKAKMLYAFNMLSNTRKGLAVGCAEYSMLKEELHNTERSEEYRRHISESKLGEKNGMFGRKLTEEHKRILRSAAAKAFKGRKHTLESRKKMSDALKGRSVWNKGKKNCYSEESLRKMSKASTGRKHTEEWKKNHSEKMKGHPNWGPKTPWNKGKKMSAEYRRKLSEAHKGKKPSAETLKKRGAAIKAALEKKKCQSQYQSQH